MPPRTLGAESRRAIAAGSVVAHLALIVHPSRLSAGDGGLLPIGDLRARGLPAALFPNAATATALIDRLVHHAEILAIEGDSYRRRVAEAKRKSPRSPSGS